jgi:hypothetical protein
MFTIVTKLILWVFLLIYKNSTWNTVLKIQGEIEDLNKHCKTMLLKYQLFTIGR